MTAPSMATPAGFGIEGGQVEPVRGLGRRDQAGAAIGGAAGGTGRLLIVDGDGNERGLDQILFLKLIAGDWIDAHDNLAIVAHRTLVKLGWPARSATRPAGMTGPFQAFRMTFTAYSG